VSSAEVLAGRKNERADRHEKEAELLVSRTSCCANSFYFNNEKY
jgi:hypothetical protein